MKSTKKEGQDQRWTLENTVVGPEQRIRKMQMTQKNLQRFRGETCVVETTNKKREIENCVF